MRVVVANDNANITPLLINSFFKGRFTFFKVLNRSANTIEKISIPITDPMTYVETSTELIVGDYSNRGKDQLNHVK